MKKSLMIMMMKTVSQIWHQMIMMTMMKIIKLSKKLLTKNILPRKIKKQHNKNDPDYNQII